MHQSIKTQMFYYGFPVVLLNTCDKDGKPNITPISSSWCLGDNLVIGVNMQNQAFDNLKACPEAVLNLADDSLWQKVEAIAPFTGKAEVPASKQAFYQFSDDKFSLGQFTPQPSLKVKPPRLAECPLQAEAVVEQITERAGYAIIELKIVQLHAQSDLLADNEKIDPTKWKPLIYNFRHYHALTDTIGKNFRCE